MRNVIRTGLFLAVVIMMNGCATNLSKPSNAPSASKVKFSGFKAVEMKPVSLATEFASSGANQKAMRKIDEHLFTSMTKVFPNLKRTESFSKGDSSVLQIAPVIKEIKFIGGGARFWVGAMAGSSAVLMQVEYRDGASGEVLADPEFYAQANAMGGAWTMGGTDNAMLERIAMDIISYTSANQ